MMILLVLMYYSETFVVSKKNPEPLATFEGIILAKYMPMKLIIDITTVLVMDITTVLVMKELRRAGLLICIHPS